MSGMMRDDLKKMAPWLGGILFVALLGMFGREFLGSRLTGEAAPDFELPIAAGEGAREGDRISLANLRGKVVVLDFWASWCGPCQESIPVLNSIQTTLADEDVVFLGVNLEPEMGPRRLQQVHADLGAEFPSVQDTTGEVKHRYAVQVLPTLVVLDRDGTVIHVESGVPREAQLESELRRALASGP